MRDSSISSRRQIWLQLIPCEKFQPHSRHHPTGNPTLPPLIPSRLRLVSSHLPRCIRMYASVATSLGEEEEKRK